MTPSLAFTLLALVAQTSAQTSAPKRTPGSGPDTTAIATQVALDRAGFSSGVIDGRMGMNTRKAMDAYRAREGRDVEPSAEPLVEYRITEQDAAGPFTQTIPGDLVEQSKLPALEYRAVDEMIAERFHTTPAALRQINPASKFAANDAIMVPNVEPMTRPAAQPAAAAAKPVGTAGRVDAKSGVVTVSKAAGTVTFADGSGRIVFFAPVTTGSENDPLPIGEWKVNGVQFNPTFRYNPDLFWDADPSHTKAKIPPGPNGPVGLVWIDISKEHFGLHGTPEPSSIGRSESHGCVRLTNWDALRLASLVGPGTRVVFTE